MSSNIAVYSTDKLTHDTSFVNNFLDDMIERYCERRFTPNTAIPNLEFPTLDQVISESYPGYYKKSPGLYASINSTHVVVVYESDMQETLNQALEHKFSRLFVQANLTSNKLTLVSALNARTFPMFDVRRQMTDYYKKRTLYKLKYHDLESVLKAPKVFFSGMKNTPALIYKPDATFAKELDSLHRKDNEKLIDDLYFFDISYMYKEGFNLELAFAISNGYFDINRFVTSEYALRMRDFATRAIEHADNKLKLIKDRILNEERLVLEEQKHQYEVAERVRQFAADEKRRQEREQQLIEEEERLKRVTARQVFASRLTTGEVDKDSSYYQQKLNEEKAEKRRGEVVPFIGMGILLAIFIILMIISSRFNILGT